MQSDMPTHFDLQTLYAVKGITDLALSPDGATIAVVRASDCLKKKKRSSDIFLLSTRTGAILTQVTHSGNASSPQWSKDGKHLYFIDFIKEDSRRKPHKHDHSRLPQLHVVTVRSHASVSKSRRLSNEPNGISTPTIASNEQFVLFKTSVDVHLVGDQNYHAADHLLYRHWTEWRDGKYTHLIQLNLHDGSRIDRTPGEFDSPTFDLGGDFGYALSPDARFLCFTSNRTDRPAENTCSRLFLMDLSSTDRSPRPLADSLPSSFVSSWQGSPAFSPDGTLLAFRYQVIDGYESDLFRLAITDLKGSLSTFQMQSTNWIDSFQWSADSKSLLLLSETNGSRALFSLSVKQTGDHTIPSSAQLPSNGTVALFSIAPDNTVFFTSSRVNAPVELFKLSDTTPIQLTHWNDAIAATLCDYQRVSIDGELGDKIDTFIVFPHNFNPNKKYPLILNVHGGPQQQWTDSFRGDHQLYAADGYVVAFCNPHGSTGYGQDFTRAISGHWGDTPFLDLMRVTDYLEQLPYVDKNRMGAMGWSFGGYMMNWFQAKTTRFKCLVSMMGVYNLKSMWGATEELWFPEFDLCGKPWNSKQYVDFSPSEYVEHFATPTLIITGEKDFRVPYTQSLEYFSALQSRGIPSRLIVFKDDGHWPHPVKSMPTYYREHLDWFRKYLPLD